MFTGIVEERGRIRRIERRAASALVEIEAAAVLADTRVGDSICVSGVCLTATRVGSASFSADVMHETLDKSRLGALRPRDAVNLERACAVGSRLGGHIVTGHIDGTGRVRSVDEDGTAVWLSISCAAGLLRYIACKGSVAIDGASLTVARVDRTGFAVSCIPHTASATTLGGLRAGDTVNIECDVLAKYLERLVGLAGLEDGTGAGGFSAGEGKGGFGAGAATAGTDCFGSDLRASACEDAYGGGDAGGKARGLDAAFLGEHGFL